MSSSSGGERPPLSEWNSAEADMLRGLFLDEADKHLRHITEAQKSLARASENSLDVDPEVVDVLFRHLHTLKGSAGSVGLDSVSRAAHELEDLCAEIRTGKLAPTFGILERIDEGISSLRALLTSARLTPPTAPPTARSDAGTPRIERRRQGDRRINMDRRTGTEGMLRVDAERLDALLDGVGDLIILRTRMDRRTNELDSVIRDLRGTRSKLRAILADPHAKTGEVVRRTEVEQLLDRLGELEVEVNGSISFLDRVSHALAADSDSVRRTSEQLEDQLRRARLVPLEWAYGRLHSALRELERSCRREADLVASGGEIELDKSVVDQITDPLLHLLRNSMAHGIEPSSVRGERGKPSRGRIEIRANQEADFINITFEDDGGGINRELVRQGLVRAGRVAEDATLDDQALLAAIFEPGFSTRSSSDAVAGRGMGLNIVKHAISRMGGEVKLEYEPGVFTRFRLSVPLSAAITQALLFKLGGQVYAVPAAHVIEILPVGPDMLTGAAPLLPRTTGRTAGPALPVLRLHAMLGVELPPGRRAAAVHARYGGRSFLFTCDKVIGPRTVVVRPPGPLLGMIPLYSGVTASGAGKAQLVLDLATLADAAHSPSPPTTAPLRRGQPRILVADGSRLAREAAARLLSTGGYQAIVAEDGWDAWEMLNERRFDALVTALEMPRVDGFELITRIRREPTLRDLPIVVLSSRTSPTTRQRALAAGADIFLPKGRHRRSLVDAITACLEEARIRGETGRT
jgi:chemosensory pili system protein ChpA (sensor histidine kinase/response regulator)